MGWWNESIYGGDASLSWREKIYKKCDSKEYGNDDNALPISTDVLKNNLAEIKEMIEKSGESNPDDANIGFQVLACVMMLSGFDINSEPGLKEILMSAAENDKWSKENALRKNAMKNLKNLIDEYDYNEPKNIEAINVFEEAEDNEEEIQKEFKEIFGLFNARIKNREKNIEEKSGVKEYDEGYQVAAEEEIEFINDVKVLMEKMEMMGVLLERINKGSEVSFNTPSANGAPTGEVKERVSSGAGNDIMPG